MSSTLLAALHRQVAQELLALPRSGWQQLVCVQRQVFAQSAFEFTRCGAYHVWLLTFSVQGLFHPVCAILSEKDGAFHATGDHMNDLNFIRSALYGRCEYVGPEQWVRQRGRRLSARGVLWRKCRAFRHAARAAANLHCQLTQKNQVGGRQGTFECRCSEVDTLGSLVEHIWRRLRRFATSGRPIQSSGETTLV